MVKKDVILALAVAVLLLGISTAAGYALVDNSPLASTIEPQGSSSYLGSVWHVLQTNVPTALSLFSGVITFGVAALFMIPLVGVFLGASISVAVDIYGLGEVIGRTIFYTPFEVVGFVVAGAAGVLPLVVLTRRFVTGHRAQQTQVTGQHGFRHTVQTILATSLKLLAFSLALLVFAAAIEGFAVMRV